jgi:hypothetical protein
MKDTPRDYTTLTIMAKHCGLVPYKNRWGDIETGKYNLEGYPYASIDLSACVADEKSILRTAVKQLSEQVDEAYNNAIEDDLAT